MNLVFLGPPGAGKGTAAEKLAVQSSIPHVSTGDLFRRAVTAQTGMGAEVSAILHRGDLVPDELTIGLVRERLSQEDTFSGFILDGFPRTIPQAEALEGFAHVDAALFFLLADDEIIRRLSGRRTCGSCGAVYHVEDIPPRRPGVCDACGSALVQRDDDRAEAVQERLAVYHARTQPLIDYYEKSGLLKSIDSSGEPRLTYAQLMEHLRSFH